jgi:Zn-dependent protease/CBS domain-containing protein
LFGTRFRLFRLFGIPINVDPSWLIILVLLTISLPNLLFVPPLDAMVPGLGPALGPGAHWGLGLVAALAFFLCIVLHEMGHALVARAGGLPIRGITLFLFGGVAEMEREPASAGKEFLMAIGGPVVSLVLGAAFWGLTVLGLNNDWPPLAVALFLVLAYVNTMVLVFNLVPAFPLDGGRVLRSILWALSGSLRRATWWASLAGQGFAWFLIGLGLLAIFSGDWGGLWFGLIGLFLNSAARGSYQSVLIRQALEGEPIRRFMNSNPVTVTPNLNLREWVEDYVYRHHHKAFPVVFDGRVEGVITTRALSPYPRQEWDHYTVGDAMLRDLSQVTISPDADALHALEQMQGTGASRLLVMENGELRGIVSLKDLLRFLQLKLELEGEGEENEPEQPEERTGPWTAPDHRQQHVHH